MIPILLLCVSMVGFVLSSTEEATQHVVGELTKQFPVYQRQITRTLVRIVEARTASGVLGTVVLVAFSTPLFGASRLVLHRRRGAGGRGAGERALGGRQAALPPLCPAGRRVRPGLRPARGPRRVRDVRLLLGDRLRLLRRLRRRARRPASLIARGSSTAQPGPRAGGPFWA